MRDIIAGQAAEILGSIEVLDHLSEVEFADLVDEVVGSLEARFAALWA